MAYDHNMLSSIRNIASQAYGSGFFEKENGGEGYMGAFVGSDGSVRVAKMLTHRSEYSAVKKAGGEAQFADAHRAMADSCAVLKDVLINIAKKSDNQSILDSVNHLLEGKRLLDRKVVAKVVTELTKGLSKEDFSWKEAAKGARTFGDTTLNTVTKAYDEVKTSIAPGKDVETRFTRLTADLLREEVQDATSAHDCAEQIRAGKFSRSWLNSPIYNALNYSLLCQLEGLFGSNYGSDGFTVSSVELSASRLDMNVESAKENEPARIFHRVLREALADEVEAKGEYPLSGDQMLRLMARAYKKAYVMTRVYTMAKSVINQIEHKFAPTDGSKAGTKETTKRSEVIAKYRADLDNPRKLLDLYNEHFSVNSLRNDTTLKDNYGFMSVGLVSKIMGGDALVYDDFYNNVDSGEVYDTGDLSNTPIPNKTNKDDVIDSDGMVDLFGLFDDSGFAGAKKIFVTQIDRCVSKVVPGTASLELGTVEKSDLNWILNDSKNRFSQD